MSNIDLLVQAKVIARQDLNEELANFIDRHLSADEVRSLIGNSRRLHGVPGSAFKQPRFGV